MNLPNKLTVLRILMIPLFILTFYLTVIPFNLVISAGVFALASFTDFLDGYLARKHNLVTDLGKFLDPIADKMLVSTALIIALCPLNGVMLFSIPNFEWISAVMVSLILARELLISGFRLVAANKGMVISADKSGKIKTFFTDIAIVITLIAGQITPISFDTLNYIAFAMLSASALLTVYSGVECLVKNKQVIQSK